MRIHPCTCHQCVVLCFNILMLKYVLLCMCIASKTFVREHISDYKGETHGPKHLPKSPLARGFRHT